MPVDDLVDTLEMYLKAVLELEEEGAVPMRARLAERFEQLTSTVSGTVQRLQRDDLVRLDPKRHLILTEAGREIAEAVMHKHRLAEVFLERVVGLEWELIHNEACRWEHVIGDRVAVLLDELLGFPERTPYGNVIRADQSRHAVGVAPEAADGLVPEGFGGVVPEAVDGFAPEGIGSLARLVSDSDGGVQARIEWIGEHLQADPEALLRLRRHGLMPGAVLHACVHYQDDQVLLVRVVAPREPREPREMKEVSSVGEAEIPLTLAAHLFARMCAEEP